jgi:hypothetical protein
MQHFEPLRRQLGIQNIDPCQIATWPGQAADQSKPDRVLGHDKNHGDCHGGLFGRNRRKIRPECSEDSDPTTDQIIGQCGQPTKLVLCPAIFDHYVLALDIADLFESLAEYGQTIRRRFRRCRVEDPDHRHRRPLRPRRERPRDCGAAEKGDELASFHLVTFIVVASGSAQCARNNRTSGSVPFARRRKPFAIVEIPRLRGTGPVQWAKATTIHASTWARLDRGCGPNEPDRRHRWLLRPRRQRPRRRAAEHREIRAASLMPGAGHSRRGRLLPWSADFRNAPKANAKPGHRHLSLWAKSESSAVFPLPKR